MPSDARLFVYIGRQIWMVCAALSRRQHRFESGRGRQPIRYIDDQVRGLSARYPESRVVVGLNFLTVLSAQLAPDGRISPGGRGDHNGEGPVGAAPARLSGERGL